MKPRIAASNVLWRVVVPGDVDADETSNATPITILSSALGLIIRTPWNHLERWFQSFCSQEDVQGACPYEGLPPHRSGVDFVPGAAFTLSLSASAYEKVICFQMSFLLVIVAESTMGASIYLLHFITTGHTLIIIDLYEHITKS